MKDLSLTRNPPIKFNPENTLKKLLKIRKKKGMKISPSPIRNRLATKINLKNIDLPSSLKKNPYPTMIHLPLLKILK